MVPHVIPLFDGDELHHKHITTPPTESSPNVGHVLIEDDEETIYKHVHPTSHDTLEHLEDTLTIPDDDPSEIDTVYHDGDSLNMAVTVSMIRFHWKL